MKYFSFIYVFLFVILMGLAPASIQAKTYVTRGGLEVDKLASMWILKRFVDKEAAFVFAKDDTEALQGIPFDIPEAALRRFATSSTFETILSHYKINDKTLDFIGQLIHDIEINTWEKKRFKETLNMQLEIGMIIKNSSNNDMMINKGMDYFDNLYDSLNSTPKT